MAKRFKLKLPKILFQSCRSKDLSNLPTNPIPTSLRLSQVSPKLTTVDSKKPPQPSRSRRSSLNCHVSFTSIGCIFGSTRYISETDCSRSTPPPTPLFHWEKQEKWHVVENQTLRRKVVNDSDFEFPIAERRPKRRSKKKKATPSRIRVSTSSDSGAFSSEGERNCGLYDDDGEEEEKEMLVSSSRSFSTDYSSSEFIVRKKTMKMRKYSKRRVSKKKKKTRTMRMSFSTSAETEYTPARLSVFMQRLLPCAAEGKSREKLVVMNGLTDPIEDPKRSMTQNRISSDSIDWSERGGFPAGDEPSLARLTKMVGTKEWRDPYEELRGSMMDIISKNQINSDILNDASIDSSSGSYENEEMKASPARLSVLMRKLVPCAVEGKVRESFAVVKKSKDPYEDFKKSMIEMIVENQMVEEKDLEQLLRCLLSLNSKEHHKDIVLAFYEIWETMFM